MYIWKDVKIAYAEKEHKIKPSLSFINHIEAETGRSITAFLIKANGRDIPVGWAVSIVASALRFAGESVTDDELYSEMGLSPDVAQMAVDIILACLPPTKQTEGASAGTGKGKKSKQTGEKFTE